MKALTIGQPYADLILWRDSEFIKRVENRGWPTAYRGQLLIHAGKSRKWLPTYFGPLPTNVRREYGAILGRVDLVDCVRMGPILSKDFGRRYKWLLRDRHAHGLYCWILEKPVRFAKPIPYVGRQKLFNVPDKVVAEAMKGTEA